MPASGTSRRRGRILSIPTTDTSGPRLPGRCMSSGVRLSSTSFEFLANDFFCDVGHDVPGNIFDHLSGKLLNHTVGNTLQVIVRNRRSWRSGLWFFFENRFQSQNIVL